MSASITEAVARERERAAFQMGSQWAMTAAWNSRSVSSTAVNTMSREMEAESFERYPAPVPPRTPRELEDPEVRTTRWRCYCGHLVWQMRGGEWYNHGAVIPTPARIRLWSDLMSHPWTDASGATYANQDGE